MRLKGTAKVAETTSKLAENRAKKRELFGKSGYFLAQMVRLQRDAIMS